MSKNFTNKSTESGNRGEDDENMPLLRKQRACIENGVNVNVADAIGKAQRDVEVQAQAIGGSVSDKVCEVETGRGIGGVISILLLGMLFQKLSS